MFWWHLSDTFLALWYMYIMISKSMRALFIQEYELQNIARDKVEKFEPRVMLKVIKHQSTWAFRVHYLFSQLQELLRVYLQQVFLIFVLLGETQPTYVRSWDVDVYIAMRVFSTTSCYASNSWCERTINGRLISNPVTSVYSHMLTNIHMECSSLMILLTGTLDVNKFRALLV